MKAVLQHTVYPDGKEVWRCEGLYDWQAALLGTECMRLVKQGFKQTEIEGFMVGFIRRARARNNMTPEQIRTRAQEIRARVGPKKAAELDRKADALLDRERVNQYERS